MTADDWTGGVKSDVLELAKTQRVSIHWVCGVCFLCLFEWFVDFVWVCAKRFTNHACQCSLWVSIAYVCVRCLFLVQQMWLCV